ncbi:MAG TPA: phosphopantetheine-binding protein [Terriglobales bacterium]|nr:phosphopantetheine-binding protein [Terriglobales bacterium]
MANTDYETISTRLSALFSEVMHLEVLSAETDLFETGILDSQRFVELLLHIEQHFNTHIDIQDFEIENFRCIEKIAALIFERKNGNSVSRFSRTHGVPSG